MPPKGKDKGKGKGKGKPDPAALQGVVKKLLKTYDKNCNLNNSAMAPNIRKAMQTAIEDEKVLTKFILEPLVTEKEGDLPVLFEPFIASLRQERYHYIRDLHVWDYPVNYENMASFGLFLEKDFYKLRMIEFMDCLLEPLSIRRLSKALVCCDHMTILNLDYNEFGDEGAKHLSAGLTDNVTLLSLSLCYCDLGVASGQHVGRVVSTTAVREVFLDGNNLESEGAMELIKLLVDQAEYEAFQRAEDVRIKAEEKALKAQEEKGNRYTSGTGTDVSGDEGGDKSRPESGKKKKKKKKGKKGKKKKGPPPPPAAGPWIHKLHLADNGIDSLGDAGSFVPIICMRLFKKLLSHCQCLEELDLEDNLIGEVGGREIMDGLSHRMKEKMGGVKVRTTHRMTADTFNSIVKLGSGGLKKKKGKKGKKKKK